MQQQSYRTACAPSSSTADLVHEVNQALELVRAAIQQRPASSAAAALTLVMPLNRAGCAIQKLCERLGVGVNLDVAGDVASIFGGLAAACMDPVAPLPATFPRATRGMIDALASVGIYASGRAIDDFLRLLAVLGERLGANTEGKMGDAENKETAGGGR